MMQYLIYLTNGENEECLLITGDRDNAIKRINVFRDVVKRHNTWFELREYESYNSVEYNLLNV